MPPKHDVTNPGARARCRHEGGEGALWVWISPHTPNVIQIDTPTVYNRTRWTVEQARELRSVLDSAIRASELS
ncbi:hypothetical protein SAMN04487904_11277 [Actinopolyspora lacussalsi subsp. righensis]|uniref:Uncharacterized protein n=1 Tax=Actinopolyspora righensis TaxID=995060 RepID=A0A1I7BQ70_9ACTN|nr:hypothetical protein [Actinopolyspora righensis]SFT89322.1 hypothetical protein SAMN04487904_11277 [Actinopolyspora righensis]